MPVRKSVGSNPTGVTNFFSPLGPTRGIAWRTPRLDILTLRRVVPLSKVVARRPLRRHNPRIFFLFCPCTALLLDSAFRVLLPYSRATGVMFVGADEPGILAGRMALRRRPEVAVCHRRGHQGLHRDSPRGGGQGEPGRREGSAHE